MDSQETDFKQPSILEPLDQENGMDLCCDDTIEEYGIMGLDPSSSD